MKSVFTPELAESQITVSTPQKNLIQFKSLQNSPSMSSISKKNSPVQNLAQIQTLNTLRKTSDFTDEQIIKSENNPFSPMGRKTALSTHRQLKSRKSGAHIGDFFNMEKPDIQSLPKKEPMPVISIQMSPRLEKELKSPQNQITVTEKHFTLTRSKKLSQSLVPANFLQPQQVGEKPVEHQQNLAASTIKPAVTIQNEAGPKAFQITTKVASPQGTFGQTFTPKLPKKVAEKFPHIATKTIKMTKSQIFGENLCNFLQIKSPAQGNLKQTDQSKGQSTNDFTPYKLDVPTSNNKIGSTKDVERVSIPRKRPESIHIQGLENLQFKSSDSINLSGEFVEQKREEEQAVHGEEHPLRSSIIKNRKGSRLFISIASPTSKNSAAKKESQPPIYHTSPKNIPLEAGNTVAVVTKKNPGSSMTTLESTKGGASTCNTTNNIKATHKSLKSEKNHDLAFQINDDSVLQEMLEIMKNGPSDFEDCSFLQLEAGKDLHDDTLIIFK